MSIDEYKVEVNLWGCWVWQGKTDKDGYGIVLRRGQRPRLAHRYVYEREVGPIAEGLVLDHGCANAPCCRPSHLEPVTQSENLYRRNWKNRAKLTKCPRGHDLQLTAIVMPTKGRVCRECNRGET